MLISLPSWKSRLKKMIKYLSGIRRVFTACPWLGMFLLGVNSHVKENFDRSLFCIVYERLSTIAGLLQFAGWRLQQRGVLRSVPDVRYLLNSIVTGVKSHGKESRNCSLFSYINNRRHAIQRGLLHFNQPFGDNGKTLLVVHALSRQRQTWRESKQQAKGLWISKDE